MDTREHDSGGTASATTGESDAVGSGLSFTFQKRVSVRGRKDGEDHEKDFVLSLEGKEIRR